MNQSQQFACALQQQFRVSSAGVNFGEIAQFRAFKDAFRALKSTFLVEEYHGAKHQVYFNTTRPWLRARARCELCDLLLLTYSTSGRRQVRLMLLQAKLSRSTHSNLCSSPGLHSRPTQFQANYEQWDLLSARPRLDPTGIFAPPPDLLRNAVVPSIGSFGVFHRTTSGAVDMFYASADTLEPVGIPKLRYGKLSTTKVPCLRNFAGFSDRPVCCCLLTFGRSLFELQIGTPVVSTSAAGGLVRHEPLSSFVRGLLGSYLRDAGANSVLAPEVLGLLGDSSDRSFSNEPLPSFIILKGSTADGDGRPQF